MAFAALLWGSVLLAATYLVGLTIHRLLLHPLARIPGPRIAALTGWYEFYWDCPKQGQYVFRIQEMHKIYGTQLQWRCATRGIFLTLFR